MSKKRTHYEILGLKESCSTQEIRESFVNLSKKFHPDKNTLDPDLHEKFVKINEAYSTLSRKALRRTYDVDLRTARAMKIHYQTASNNHYSTTKDEWDPSNFTWRDESIWPKRNRHNQKYDSDAYYGIKGIPRKPNTFIAAGACMLIVIGAVFHYLAFKHSQTFSIHRMNQAEQILTEHLEKTRKSAESNGNDQQLNVLLARMKSRQNLKPLPKP